MDICICGCKESCFENGECWGHWEGVMCKHLGEREINNQIVSFCVKKQIEVLQYTTKIEYDSIHKR